MNIRQTLNNLAEEVFEIKDAVDIYRGVTAELHDGMDIGTAKTVARAAWKLRNVRGERFIEIAKKTKDKDAIKSVARLLIKYGGEQLYWVSQGLSQVCDENNADSFRNACELIGGGYQRDPKTADVILENIYTICKIFGDKYEGILSYLVGRRDRESAYAISHIIRTSEIEGAIKKINLSDFGNKQAAKLVRLALLLNWAHNRGVNPDVSEDLHSTLDNVESSFKQYVESKLGITPDKAMEFLQWTIVEHPLGLRILKGETIEKNGIAASYSLRNLDSGKLKGIKKELSSYVERAGLDICVEDGDMSYYKDLVAKIMSEMGKRSSCKEILEDIKPRLNKISNLTHRGSRNYTLHLDPSNLEYQMKALQGVFSCFSPCAYKKRNVEEDNGNIDNSEYVERYLESPNTFFAVIRGSENGDIVGRFPVLIGKYEGGTKIARGGRVYSIANIDEVSVDQALNTYAAAMGAEYMTKGCMVVEGLGKVYEGRDSYLTMKDGIIHVDNSLIRG